MKKLLRLGLFAAALSAVPASAHAWETGGPIKVRGGVKIYLNIQYGAANLPLAPWYLYYPASAQYQPIGPPVAFYPNWPQQPPGGPAPRVPEPVQPPGPPGPRVPEPLPAPGPGQPVQRTGYYAAGYTDMRPPAYWYGQ